MGLRCQRREELSKPGSGGRGYCLRLPPATPIYAGMSNAQNIFIGTDSGATTSKIAAVWENGEPVTKKLQQAPTPSAEGTAAVVRGWITGINGFLAANQLAWSQVQGVGLAIPGPYKRYGVMDRTPNLPASFDGWDFHADYSAALAQAAGRPIPLVAGNDGNYGGVAEAKLARGESQASVLMLMPGSGLGLAIVKQVVVKHGGMIRIGETTPGGDPPGTSFFVLLPGLPGQSSYRETSAVSEIAHANGEVNGSVENNTARSRVISVDSQ